MNNETKGRIAVVLVVAGSIAVPLTGVSLMRHEELKRERRVVALWCERYPSGPREVMRGDVHRYTNGDYYAGAAVYRPAPGDYCVIRAMPAAPNAPANSATPSEPRGADQ